MWQNRQSEAQPSSAHALRELLRNNFQNSHLPDALPPYGLPSPYLCRRMESVKWCDAARLYFDEDEEENQIIFMYTYYI